MVTYMRDILLDTHIFLLLRALLKVILGMINLPRMILSWKRVRKFLRPDLDCISRIPEQQARRKTCYFLLLLKKRTGKKG